MAPRYPLITPTTLGLAVSALLGRRRSFQADARALAERLRPPLQVEGGEHIPADGPRLITVNHYSRPGFPSWWVALGVSAALPVEVHWIMTSAWVFPGRPLKNYTLAPLTRWAFGRLARAYGFTRMPPMPPSLQEVGARARAVRQALAFARQAPHAVIGLAPEGGDAPEHVLAPPPAGAGRFMLHLAGLGLPVTPAGLFEAGGALHVRFGPCYRLSLPPGLPKEAADRQAGQVVMRGIARLLPEDLRGEYV
jgi:1-acyl-sn-glycerol-3-phosphate acyltransferase